MDSEHMRAARWAATATVLSSLIAAAATLAATGKFAGGDASAAVSGARPSQGAIPDASTAATAQVSLPEDHRVDVCTTFSGTGNIPDDVILWIALKDSEGYIFLEQPVEVRQGEWRTTAIEVSDGSDEDRVKERTVLALAVPKALSDVLNDFRRTGIGPTTHELPGVEPLHEIRITPLGSRTKCPT